MGFRVGVEYGHDILCSDGLERSLGLLCSILEMVTTLNAMMNWNEAMGL